MNKNYIVGVVDIPDNGIMTLDERWMPLNVFCNPVDGRRLLAALRIIETEPKEEKKEEL